MQATWFHPVYEFFGYVEVLGPVTITSLHVGDLVTSLTTIGGCGTYVVMPVTDVIKLKSSDDSIYVSALTLNYMTAYGVLRRSGVTLERGSSVLISSVSGGVGTAVAELAHAFDMGLTLYGTYSPSKFSFVKSLGITPIERNIENLAERVRELNGGEGVDVSYDAVGSKESLEVSAVATKEGTGEVVVVGFMANIAPDGSGVLNFRFDAFEEIWLEDFEKVLQVVRNGKLKPIIGNLFKLSEAVEANDMLVSGAGVMGKMEFIVDAVIAKSKSL